MGSLSQNIVIFIIIHTCSSISKASTVSTKLPLWTWECLNEKCVPNKAMPNGKLQSLETCNMICSTIQIWPHPTGPVSLSTTAVAVRADLFHLVTVNAPNTIVQQHLQDTFEVFRQDLRSMQDTTSGFREWHNVQVKILVNESGDSRMRVDTDESYELRLHPAKSTFTLSASITARSFCGARHALETLSQLVWLDHTTGSLLIIKAASVHDKPRFRYRGLMIDTARSYFPPSALIRTIDAMAGSKLNTFHWHVSDSQAFSLLFSDVSQLAEHGAYSHNNVYTTEQVITIVRRARLRGIRVIIEVDTPAHVGHAWDWDSKTDTEDLVFCLDSELWPTYCSMPPCGQLNPTNPQVYNILQRVYSEIIQLTGVDDLFHLGGSDISERCWAELFNDTDPNVLWVEYTKSALQSLESVNGNIPNLTLLWTSRLSNRLKTDLADYVSFLGLQTRQIAWAAKYESGLRTVVSHEDTWDLNSGLGEWYEENGGAPYNSWQKVYEHRPWVKNGIMGVIEGGEATVWSWSLNTGELDSRLWPRAAAFAERLWADRTEGASRPVHARLDVHRTRMVNRGIEAAPLWSNWCTQNSYTCN